MDVERLLRVLTDVIDQETANNYAAELQALATAVKENTTESIERANATRASLQDSLLSSPLNDYPASYQQIVEKIGARGYVGIGIIGRLNDIFSAGPLNLAVALSDYASDYQIVIDRVRVNLENLKKLGAEPYDGDFFEAGLIIPGDITHIEDVVGHLHDLDIFLRLCSQIAGDEDPTPKLSAVSNGSTEFFSPLTPQGAAVANAVLFGLLKLYQEYKKAQKLQLEVEQVELQNGKLKLELAEKAIEVQNALQEQIIQQTADDVIENHFQGNTDFKEKLHGELMVAIKLIMSKFYKGLKLEVSEPAKKSDAAKTSKKSSAAQSGLQSLPSTAKALNQLYAEHEKNPGLLPSVSVTKTAVSEIRTELNKMDATNKSEIEQNEPKNEASNESAADESVTSEPNPESTAEENTAE